LKRRASPAPRTFARVGLIGSLIGGLAFGLACGGGAEAPVSTGPLPPGAVARVGGRAITADEVARIARAQGVDPARARDIAVRDTLLARGAEARGLQGTEEVRLAWEAELSRLTLRRQLAEARATPPTEAELAAAASRRWLEVDRPEGMRTVHALVRFEGKDDDAQKARARALAEVIRGALLPVAARAPDLSPVEGAPRTGPRIAPADDPDPLSGAFRQAATAVPTEGLQVQVEPLPAVTADGRVLAAGDEHFDLDFVRAAAALPARGALSPVVVTRFGAHVIMLLERTPAVVLTGEARENRLRDDIVNERARAAEKRLLAAGRDRRSVAPDAAALLGLVVVDR
jgi:hypothetical protein